MNEKINEILSDWSLGRHIDENKKGNAVRFLFTLIDNLFELVDELNKEVEELKNQNHGPSDLIEAEVIQPRGSLIPLSTSEEIKMENK